MTPAATSQARGVSHNQKTIKSRRELISEVVEIE